MKKISPLSLKVRKSLCLISIFTLLCIKSYCEKLITFDCAGLTGIETKVASNYCIEGLKVSALTRGSGIKAFAKADLFSSNYWTTSSKFDKNDYLELTITPDCGKSFIISEIIIHHKRSLTGPLWFSIKTNYDSFLSDQGGIVKIEDDIDLKLSSFKFTLAEINSSLTIRIYAFYAESSAGNWGPGGFGGNDVIINGIVNSAPVLINEIDVDTYSDDYDEFVELYDGGCGNTILTDNVLVLYDGTNDISYKTIDLEGYMTDGNGYFVIGSSNVENVDLAYFSDINVLRNGSNAIALFKGKSGNYPVGMQVDTTNLIDAIVYSNDTPEDIELLKLLNEGEGQINENMLVKAEEYSLQRIGDGAGSARNTNTYATAMPTPGQKNYDAIWTGNTNEYWSMGSNWIPYSKTPSSDDKVFIPRTSTLFPKLESSQTIGEVILDHDAYLSGQEYLSANSISIYHKVYFSSYNSDLDRWQYISSPFSNLQAESFLSQNKRVDLWIAQYENSKSSAINEGWNFELSTSGSLYPGIGYAITAINDKTEEGRNISTPWYLMKISGKLTEADTNIPIFLQVDSSAWNMIGNPYIAPIDWFDAINIDYSVIQGRTAYIYNPSNGSYISLISDGTGSGITVPEFSSNNIPPMQGFFVEANSETIFNINPDSRSQVSPPFYKSSEISEYFRIIVSDSMYSDETIISINQFASNGFDEYDAHKLFATNNKIPQLYSTAGFSHKLVQNCIKSVPVEIDITVVAEKGELLKFKFINTKTLGNNKKITIKNIETLEEYDVSDNSEILFKTPVNSTEARFSLSIEEKNNQNNSIKSNGPEIFNISNQIICRIKECIPAKLEIYDLSGRLIKTESIKDQETKTLLEKSKGIFIVRFISEKFNTQQKIIINP